MTMQRRASLEFSKFSVDLSLEELSVTNRLPFVNREAECLKLATLLSAAERSMQRGEQKVTVPMIVGLSGIGKSTFARQAALKIVPDESDDLRAVTCARIRYMQRNQCLIRIDLSDIPQISNVEDESFDRSFLAALRDQLKLQNTPDTTPAPSGDILADGLSTITKSLPSSYTEDDLVHSRAILLNLDETNHHIEGSVDARKRFGGFVNRLVGAASKVYRDDPGSTNTAIFITLSGTHAHELFEATSASSKVRRETISLPPLTVEHMQDVIQKMLPEDKQVRKSRMFLEALAWCGGVPRYLELFLHGLFDVCSDGATLIDTLSASTETEPESQTLQRRIQRALDSMLRLTPIVPRISYHGPWIVPCTLFLLFHSGECDRDTIVTPNHAWSDEKTDKTPAAVKSAALTVSQLEAAGVVFFHESSRTATIPHPMLHKLLNHGSFDEHPLQHLRWLWMPDKIMSPEDNEMVSLCVLAARLHFVRLFRERPTLADLFPPLKVAAATHAEYKAAARSLAKVSVACEDETKACPSVAKIDKVINRSNVRQVWEERARQSTQGRGILNKDKAPFADSMLWADTWALFVQDKQSVVARQQSEAGEARTSESHGKLEAEFQKVFKDGRPLPRKCTAQLFVMCTDKMYGNDVYCMPQGRMRKFFRKATRLLLVLHAGNQESVFGALWPLKQRRVQTSRAGALETET